MVFSSYGSQQISFNGAADDLGGVTPTTPGGRSPSISSFNGAADDLGGVTLASTARF